MQRSQLVYMIRLSDQTGRVDDSLKFLKDLMGLNVQLNNEERNLLKSITHKVMGTKMDSWRYVVQYQKDNQEYPSLVEDYRKNIEQDLTVHCNDIVELLKAILTRGDNLNVEERIFYLSLQGKYQDYLYRIADTTIRPTMAEEVLKIYQETHDMANKQLYPYDPILLELVLNVTMFYKEVMNKTYEAIQLSKDTFDRAMKALDTSSPDSYRNSTIIMQLLRDNVTRWSVQNESIEEEPDQ